ncbi:MAG: bifunctional transaldolase/phosoglucose isomerase [Candidatus Palauibacterales bacterium]|nr:bifunctional transaldolase/phosoglucose isomerase [Candidatus Palauibacterales bacterium]
MEILLDLLEHGQSYWLDNLTRRMIRGGELERRVGEQGLRGVTSNPAIFHKAISSGSDYDEQIRDLAAAGTSVEGIYESLVVTDIREACDVLKPVYDSSAGVDGYVSLEVSPHLVHDTEGSLEEARHLWDAVARPNLMIKIPGTSAGVPAIEQLLYEGINVNITLLFAVGAYEQVARAYVRALQRRAAEGSDLESVASVASFFLSRIDVLVDALLSHHVREPAPSPAAQDLFGKAAVASAKLAYRSYLDLLAGPEWTDLANAGARPQRLLWASTSTKNPLYDPIRYVEPLIGRDTVNTMPEVTIEAFSTAGRITPDAVEEGVEDSERVFAALAGVGIDMNAVNEQLLAEGAQKFVDPFDALLAGLAEKRSELRAGQRTECREPAEAPRALGPSLSALREKRFAVRLAGRDPSLWAEDEPTRAAIANRLGWTRGASAAAELLPALTEFAAEIRAEGIRDVVLLGMGGSSLCPLVAARTFAGGEGFPRLTVLDNVDPSAVARVDESLDLARTLFIVASKSGGTIETLSLYRFFRDRVEREGLPVPGQRFIAITDPGSPLLEEASRHGFRRTFEAPPDVGGRYSALTVFGLLPMALLGVDVGRVVEWAGQVQYECSPALSEAANPAVRLGCALALHARDGRNKLTLTTSPGVESFPLWIEQLIAESTGKNGTGILPVTGEPIPAVEACPGDRVFVHYTLEGDDDPASARLDEFAAAGHPVYRLRLPEPEALGGEFLRWEVATATAGAILGVNPFDEPDVSAAKRATADLLERRASEGEFPVQTPRASDGGLDLFGDAGASGADGTSVAGTLNGWLDQASEGGYVAVLAYFEATPKREAALAALRDRLRARSGLATTLGYGPRYLHSTGQLHKGGPQGGLFLVLSADPVEDLSVPGSDFSLGTLQRAQALGDVATLEDRGRHVLRAHLGWLVEPGLEALVRAV